MLVLLSANFEKLSGPHMWLYTGKEKLLDQEKKRDFFFSFLKKEEGKYTHRITQ